MAVAFSNADIGALAAPLHRRVPGVVKLAGRERCQPSRAVLEPSHLQPAAQMHTQAAATAEAAQMPGSLAQAPQLLRLDSLDTSSALSLPNIRDSLIRQEDSIIFALIERAQFAHDEPVYLPDAVPVPGFSPDGRRYSLLEYLLRETEHLHGKIRRYTSPDEQAFFPSDLPSLVLPAIQYQQDLAAYHREVNVNADILAFYTEHVLEGITEPGNDNNYGSAAMLDVLCLQALSKRIHCGKFVAEAKFRTEREKYGQLIARQDAQGILDALTNREVELQVLERVKRKAAAYGRDPTAPDPCDSAGSSARKILPERVRDLYETWIMPLTKRVEVEYLLRRLEVDSTH